MSDLKLPLQIAFGIALGEFASRLIHWLISMI